MLGKTYWDNIAGVYDAVEKLFNGRCYDNLGKRVAEEMSEDDYVLECACGTGAITASLAKKCRKVRATDLSTKMMRKAEKNCRGAKNVRFCKANIMELKCGDEVFDNVVAGNVIHLLDEPKRAIDELVRVCKRGGKVIIPTYVNISNRFGRFSAKVFELAGVRFTKEFDMDSYRQFFAECGYGDAEFDLVEGRVPCAIAIITKH